MFKENKYTNLYNKLINRSVERNWKKASGRERHHIIPQSLGGSNDKNNLTYLSAREHFICHWLLIKMTEGEARSKMLYALMGMRAMSENHQRYSSSVTSRVYQKYRIEHALNHSTTMKQKNLVHLVSWRGSCSSSRRRHVGALGAYFQRDRLEQ